MSAVKIWRLALDIGGLSALALSYPLFEVLSQSPEFFVARNSTPAHVVFLACIVCFIVPALLFSVARVAVRLNASAGAYVHEAILALLVVAMVMTWLNRVDGLAVWAGVSLAIAAGLAFAVGYRRAEAVRLFVTALSPAILVVPVSFLLNGNVRDALAPAAEGFATAEFGEAPPIVFIVFDEFPLNSLLDENYEIDADRYPNVSALATQSYWFRNTTTVSLGDDVGRSGPRLRHLPVGAGRRTDPPLLSGQSLHGVERAVRDDDGWQLRGAVSNVHVPARPGRG